LEETADDPLRQLAERAAQRDTEAFRQLYELYADQIFRHIYLKVGNHDLAEDLTQTVFLKAWEAIDRFQWRDIPFHHWLLRTARNTVIDHFRTRKPPPEPVPEELPATDDPEGVVLQGVTIDELRRAIQRLSSDQQDVILLRFVEELPAVEVGQIIGKSEAAVRVIQHRALAALRKQLGREDSRSVAPD